MVWYNSVRTSVLALEWMLIGNNQWSGKLIRYISILVLIWLLSYMHHMLTIENYRGCCCRKRSNSDPSYRLWEIYYICNIAGSILIILFATTAFSMGIDCPDSKNVIHCGAPSTTEQYIQETGQAGRNGVL